MMCEEMKQEKDVVKRRSPNTIAMQWIKRWKLTTDKVYKKSSWTIYSKRGKVKKSTVKI